MPDTASAARVPAEQRVFSLLLALISSPQGLTKTDLLSSVYGYADRFQQAGADASLDRQFERDKDQLRELGVPVETLDDPSAPGDNRLTRYRIVKQRFDLPPEVRFSADELSLLKLAAAAWSEGSLDEVTRWAQMRITALSGGLDLRHLGIAPRIGFTEPAAAALRQGIAEHRVARFSYQLPDRDEPLPRTVAPLHLHRAEGRWHLIAFDLEREAPRVFLLSRIASTVALGPDTFDPSLSAHTHAALGELQQLAEQQLATVLVASGSVAEARLAARAESRGVRDGQIELTLRTLDYHALAIEIAGYGSEARVTAPVQLRELVRGRLQQVREQHGVTHG